MKGSRQSKDSSRAPSVPVLHVQLGDAGCALVAPAVFSDPEAFFAWSKVWWVLRDSGEPLPDLFSNASWLGRARQFCFDEVENPLDANEERELARLLTKCAPALTNASVQRELVVLLERGATAFAQALVSETRKKSKRGGPDLDALLATSWLIAKAGGRMSQAEAIRCLVGENVGGELAHARRDTVSTAIKRAQRALRTEVVGFDGIQVVRCAKHQRKRGGIFEAFLRRGERPPRLQLPDGREL